MLIRAVKAYRWCCTDETFYGNINCMEIICMEIYFHTNFFHINSTGFTYEVCL